jgi:hypothetical protein
MGGRIRFTVAVAALVTMLLLVMPAPSHAGAAVDAALALGAFAVFSQLILLPALAQTVYTAPPAVVYTAPPVAHAAPAAPARPAIRREVVYSHGRHVLLGDGVTVAYQWVWVPNPPAGPPPPPPR